MEYDEFIADQILDLVADGWSLERIHKEIPGMPNRNQFLRWRRDDAKLSARYEKAIQDRVAYSFDKLSDAAFCLLDPKNTEWRGRMTELRAATDILLKLMGNSSMIVQGYVGKIGDPSAIPHIKVEFVESTEEKPPEAE